MASTYPYTFNSPLNSVDLGTDYLNWKDPMDSIAKLTTPNDWGLNSFGNWTNANNVPVYSAPLSTAASVTPSTGLAAATATAPVTSVMGGLPQTVTAPVASSLTNLGFGQDYAANLLTKAGLDPTLLNSVNQNTVGVNTANNNAANAANAANATHWGDLGLATKAQLIGGTLMGAFQMWNAFQMGREAKKQLEWQRNMYNKQWEASKKQYNTKLRDRAYARFAANPMTNRPPEEYYNENKV